MWDTKSPYSGWRFFNVSQEEVDAILGTIDQFKRNEDLASLVSDVKAAYKKGFTYESDATADGDFSNHGLLTDVTQLWTNGAEPSEGPIENLLDGNIGDGNFFHTAWSADGKAAAPADTYYYLAADLGEAVQDLQIKIASRINKNSVNANDRPTLVEVYASNYDAVKPADGAATGDDEIAPDATTITVTDDNRAGGEEGERAPVFLVEDVLAPVEELEHIPHESCIQHYNGIKWLGIKPYDYVHGWWYYKSDEPANYILRNYTIKIK